MLLAQLGATLLAATATVAEVDPMLLMVPAVLSASCAFMLPVATPPNAIVFGSGLLTIPKMARAGFALNLIGIVLVSAAALTLASRFAARFRSPAAALTLARLADDDGQFAFEIVLFGRGRPHE